LIYHDLDLGESPKAKTILFCQKYESGTMKPVEILLRMVVRWRVGWD
jgi:hypothetical protein